MEEKIRIVIYNKSSNTKQGMEAVKICKDYIDSMPNMKLVKCYNDFYSRKVKVQNRHALKKLLKEKDKLYVKLVITASMSRITRKVIDFAWVMNELKNADLDMYFVREETFRTKAFPEIPLGANGQEIMSYIELKAIKKEMNEVIANYKKGIGL